MDLQEIVFDKEAFREELRTQMLKVAKLEEQNCRGIVTADVLELGLSRGAIATRKLEGVNVGRGTRGFILVRPLTMNVKAYVQLRWY